MERKTERRGLWMVISLLSAIVLWMYVGMTVNPDDTRTLRNLPIRIIGQNALEDRGLMVTTGSNYTATIRVTGKRDALSALAADTDAHVEVTVDLSDVEAPGQYTREIQVTFKLSGVPTSSSVALADRYTPPLTYTVTREVKRTVPVRGVLTGSVAEGFQAGEFSFDPWEVDIRGEESIVNQVSYLKVSLNEANLTTTYEGELPYTYVSYTGEELDGANIIANFDLVRTTFPVFQIKEVPLTVNIVPGGGATTENVEVRIEPASLMVSGSAVDLEPLSFLSLGDIDLAKILGSDTVTFPVRLSSELTNVSGVSEATVTITVQGLTTAILQVDSIELIHIPNGYTAQAVTQTREIQIRGEAEAVESVTASQLRMVADLNNAVATTGNQTIPVKVYLDGRSDVGVIGDYNIVISVEKK